jgi:hypothetical protein
MKNIGDLVKQAQKMQQKMAEMQADLPNIEVEGKAGGGMVTCTMNGERVVSHMTIDDSLLENPAEKEILEDLVAASVNDALRKVEEEIADKTKGALGDFDMPEGMNLPF